MARNGGLGQIAGDQKAIKTIKTGYHFGMGHFNISRFSGTKDEKIAFFNADHYI